MISRRGNFILVVSTIVVCLDIAFLLARAQECRVEYKWTEWFDQDDPSGTGDWEIVSELLRDYPDKLCDSAVAIQVNTLDGQLVEDTPETPFNYFDPRRGIGCQNRARGPEGCPDYKVRFCCPAGSFVEEQSQQFNPNYYYYYVITSPKTIRPGVPFSVFFSYFKERNVSEFKASILRDDEIIHEKIIYSLTGGSASLELQLPLNAEAGEYKLHVKGQFEDGYSFRNKSNLVFESDGMIVLIQTDKAIYKPGQTVFFRAMAIFPDFMPYTGTMDIEIMDPEGNLIKKWIELEGYEYGVVNQSLPTSTEPILGDWKIKVIVNGIEKTKVFSIDEYKLPKFEVTITAPPFILKSDSELGFKVSAKYTYGKPVIGQSFVTITHPQSTSSLVFVINDFNGETELSIAIDQLQKILYPNRNNYYYRNSYNMFSSGQKLNFIANVTDDLTGIELSGSSSIDLHEKPVKLKFLETTPKFFKPGLNLPIYISAMRQDNSPLQFVDKHTTTLQYRYTFNQQGYPKRLNQQGYFPPRVESSFHGEIPIVFPDSGIAQVELNNIPNNTTRILLMLYDYYTDSNSEDISLTVKEALSPSHSFVEIETLSEELSPGDTATFFLSKTNQFNANDSVDQLYRMQIISRGNIVQSQIIDINQKEHNVVMTTDMAPTATILVFYITNDGEIVASSLSLSVKEGFDNQVSVEFSEDEHQPGEEARVDVKADPQSFVGLLAVDQSVLLLKSGNDITQDEVMGELSSKFGQEDLTDSDWWRWSCFWIPQYGQGRNAHQVFKSAGLNIMTNGFVYQSLRNNYEPQPNILIRGQQGPMDMDGFPERQESPIFNKYDIAALPRENTVNEPLQEVTKIRKVFPETWLWIDTITDGNGESSVVTAVPDTITSWVASAFAVNTQSGLGIAANTAKMTVFKPFFVTLNLPYSVIRGEHLAVQALVFNYMDVDMQVVVTLEGNEAFQHIVIDTNDIFSAGQNTESGDKKLEILVEANSGKSVSFPIVPTGLGYVSLTVKAQSTLAADGLTRLLLVEPEGFPQTYASSDFVDLNEFNGSNLGRVVKSFQVQLPTEQLVDGSVKTRFSATGDVIGPALSNLDKLLQMPTGCGEQNMIGFAPDVFIYKYLTITGQSNSEISEKALNYMTIGYQRELTYRHTDGSFSAFGERDESGSTWLTAFVMRSFTQAAGFIYVDPKILEKGIHWLVWLQRSDGGFNEVGNILDGRHLQGATSGRVSLTAYVLISLLEENKKVNLSEGLQDMVMDSRRNALSYLEFELERIRDTHTLAIVTYALTLANSPKADQAFQMMDQKAVMSNGERHWEESGKSSVDHDSWYWQPASADVEISSYALLTYLARGDLSGSLAIVKWLTGQRNPYGGFGSTQDTVVGLQALAEFATQTGIGEGQTSSVTLTVRASQDNSLDQQLMVTDSNALILQQIDLAIDGGEVEVECEGYGTALIQLSVMYNVMEKQNDASFDLNLIVSDIDNNRIGVEACGKWLKAGASGMAVMEMSIPSGFYVEETPLQHLISGKVIKRYETDSKKVNLYFDEMTANETCVSVTIQRSNTVAKTQPSSVLLYDYYKPENSIEKAYQSYRLNSLSICEVCQDCYGCSVEVQSVQEKNMPGKDCICQPNGIKNTP